MRREKAFAVHGRRAVRALSHRPVPKFSADFGKRSRRRKISARWPFDGQIARRRISHRRVLGARAVCRFAGAGHACFDVCGTPLACAVALKVLEVIERERLDEQARKLGEWFKRELERLAATYPQVVRRARGLGFILGLELVEKEKIPAFAASNKTAALQFVNRLHEIGVLTIPAGTQIVRLLPPLNLKPQEAGEGISKIEEVIKSVA